jgi:hypothetical protein
MKWHLAKRQLKKCQVDETSLRRTILVREGRRNILRETAADFGWHSSIYIRISYDYS